MYMYYVYVTIVAITSNSNSQVKDVYLSREGSNVYTYIGVLSVTSIA